MRILYITAFSLLVGLLSCKSQKSETNQFTETDYDVLDAFLQQFDQFHYVDKILYNHNLVTDFVNKFSYHQNFQKNADSICRNSEDITSRKIYCPIADKFAYYENLLNHNELKQIQKRYDKKGKSITLQIDSIISNSLVRKHSKEYYHNNDKAGMPQKMASESPSIRILNLYYNENNSVAIVAFSISNSSSKTESNYMFFKKMDEVWWKPMGSFSL